MTFYAEVNPANTSQIWPADINQREYNSDNLGPWECHGGARFQSLPGPQPWDGAHLYTMTRDTSPAPSPYHVVTGRSYAFVGALYDPLATVQETVTWALDDIETIRVRKRDELEDQYARVALSACDLTGNGGGDNWALILDEQQRRRFGSVSGFFFDRDGDIAGDSAAGSSDTGLVGAILSASTVDFPTFVSDLQTAVAAIKQRWAGARTVPMRLRHKVNGSEIIYQVSDIGVWGGLHKDVGVFDGLADDAYVDARQDIDTETDQAALAAIDVTAYAWPPHWPAPV